MSMSQLKTPDEEWDEIWQSVRWYHLPLIALSLVGMWLCLTIALAIGSLRRKK